MNNHNVRRNLEEITSLIREYKIEFVWFLYILEYKSSLVKIYIYYYLSFCDKYILLSFIFSLLSINFLLLYLTLKLNLN